MWKLAWDSAAVEALKPTGAALSIQDGASEQGIPLAKADLSSGTVYYTPKSGDLALSLEPPNQNVVCLNLGGDVLVIGLSGGPSRASSKAFFPPSQNLLVNTSFIPCLA